MQRGSRERDHLLGNSDRFAGSEGSVSGKLFETVFANCKADYHRVMERVKRNRQGLLKVENLQAESQAKTIADLKF